MHIDAHILVVEDDAAALMLTKRVLAKDLPNIIVDTAVDGVDALEHIAAASDGSSPALLLMLLDWNLPRKHGREVLSEVRKNPKMHDLPIIIVTSSCAETDIEEAIKLGANEFVHKSLSLEDFRQQLTETCRHYL